MKRKRESRRDQIPLKKPNSGNSTEPLRSKIKAKLHSLFDGFVSDLQTISKEADPDLTILLDSHVSQFMNGNHKDKKLLSVPGLDHSSLLQNFVNSAKSRLSGLLKQEPIFVSNNKSFGTTSKSCEALSKKSSVDPLQVHISQKVHSLLSKACDKKLANGEKSHPSENFIESELHGFSSVLQDFINSAKRKLSSSLSNGHSRKIPGTVNGIVPKKSQLCGVSINNSEGPDYKCNSNSEHFTRSKKITSTYCPSNHPNTRKASLHSSKMYSPRISESDTLEEDALCIPDARNCKNVKGGMLFLEDAERVPEYLDLEIHSDVEDQDSSSDEDVIVLGEKRPIYEEITLEEDSDEEDSAEKKSGENEELLFQCSQCEKAFRVESLLKFHVRMHGSEEKSLSSPTEDSSLKRRSDSDEDESTKSTKKHESSKRKDKENKTKSNPRSSQAKKSCQEKRPKHNKRKHVSKHS